MFFWRGVSSVDAAARQLDADLADMEERADRAPPQQRASLFNRAGDQCAAMAGREKLAVSYYGRSINCYIEAGMYGPAAVLCRKLISFSPEVVRAHCTLAVLALLDRQSGDAAREIDQYVRAARRSRTERLAIPRLRMMAETTEEPALRHVLVDALRSLGDMDGANQVLRGMVAVAPAEREARLVHVATLDPHEIWGRVWIETPAPLDGRRRPLGDLALREDLPPPPPGDRWGKSQ